MKNSHAPSSRPPLVIPIFIPHAGCPHQCIFCNQSAITAATSARLPSHQEIEKEVMRYLAYKGTRNRVELAFFGGNFLGLEIEAMERLLDTAQSLFQKRQIDGIRFSTRPDTITEEKLNRLTDHPITTVEIGVQSMSDAVLKKSRRGHTRQDILRAVTLLKDFGVLRNRPEIHCPPTSPPTPLSMNGEGENGNVISCSFLKPILKWHAPCRIGMQMMVGLPGDTPETALESARDIAALMPDFVRIYPLVVLKGSPLEQRYHQGKYRPLSLEESVHSVKEIYTVFKSHGIDVVRMGLQSSDLMESDTIVAGPWHPAFGHLVHSARFLDIAVKKIEGCLQNHGHSPTAIVITVHPASLSRLLGNRKENLKRLSQKFPTLSMEIDTDHRIEKNDIDVKKHRLHIS